MVPLQNPLPDELVKFPIPGADPNNCVLGKGFSKIEVLLVQKHLISNAELLAVDAAKKAGQIVKGCVVTNARFRKSPRSD